MSSWDNTAKADRVVQVDSTGTYSQAALVNGSQRVALYDSLGNALITRQGNADAQANTDRGQLVMAQNYGLNPAGTWDRQRLNSLRDLIVQQRHAQVVSATAAAGSAVTLTIPAAGAGIFNYLVYLQIVLYAAAALTGGASPQLVTTTGIVGTPTFTFPTALAIGTVAEQKIEGGTPIVGTAANTAMTIVTPALANAIYRVNAAFFTA